MVTWENYEEYMLLYADNELNEAEVKTLMAFVEEHPELKKELNAYAATKLVPDKELVFENKDILLKKGGSDTIALNRWYYYAAAAAVLFFAVFIVNREQVKNENTAPIAKTESKAAHPITGDTAGKDLHSLPVNPVATETTVADNKPATTTIKKHTAPVKKAIKTYTPQTQKTQDIYVAQDEPKKTERPTVVSTENKPALAVNTQADKKQEVPAVTKSTPEEPNAAPEEESKKGLLAWLPIRKEKKEGVTALADAVNDKLEKVKKLKNNLKDADVTVKIGNTELFVVRL